MRGIGAGANVPSLSRDAGERAANAGTSSIASERKVMAHPRAADARTPLKAYMLDAASYRSAADTAVAAGTLARPTWLQPAGPPEHLRTPRIVNRRP